MKSNEQRQGAGKCAKQKVNASTKKQSEKPAENDIIQLTGIATYDLQTNSFLFEPSDVAYGLMEGYVLHGTSQRLSDGTQSFDPVKRKRYKSQRILKLPHGSVSLTQSGNYHLQLSVSVYDPDPAFTLYKEAAAASVAVHQWRTYGRRIGGAEYEAVPGSEPLTTKMDRIIYRGIAKQSEAAPYSEDPTQGGEVLPSAKRNGNRNSNDEKLKSHCGSSKRPRKGQPKPPKHSDRQGLVEGGSC